MTRQTICCLHKSCLKWILALLWHICIDTPSLQEVFCIFSMLAIAKRKSCSVCDRVLFSLLACYSQILSLQLFWDYENVNVIDEKKTSVAFLANLQLSVINPLSICFVYVIRFWVEWNAKKSFLFPPGPKLIELKICFSTFIFDVESFLRNKLAPFFCTKKKWSIKNFLISDKKTYLHGKS